MRVVVTGTRGIPNIQGGIETHCQELYPRLVARGFDIIVVRRKGYANDSAISFKGVKLLDISAPQSKHFEAVVHTISAISYAYRNKADAVHIHGIGPSLLTPLTRLLGLKVIVTHHGADYRRTKWGIIAKVALRIGEYAACHWADKIIVISPEIQTSKPLKHRPDTELIPNGVLQRNNLNISPSNQHMITEALNRYNLIPYRYFLAIGRFVPEKGFDDLIHAFAMARNTNFRLVIAGTADHKDKYYQYLRNLAAQNNIICPGFLSGNDLYELQKYAGYFVIPSHYEGLPIVLLEAMSHRLSVIASDITAHRQLGLGDDCYYTTGDIEALSHKISTAITQDPPPRIDYDLSQYDWECIADRTATIYNDLYTTLPPRSNTEQYPTPAITPNNNPENAPLNTLISSLFSG